MELQLTEDEARVLAEVLEQAAANLRQEIGSTDLFEYRTTLKQREEVCRTLGQRLRSLIPETPSSPGR